MRAMELRQDVRLKAVLPDWMSTERSKGSQLTDFLSWITWVVGKSKSEISEGIGIRSTSLGKMQDVGGLSDRWASAIAAWLYEHTGYEVDFRDLVVLSNLPTREDEPQWHKLAELVRGAMTK